MRSNIEKFAKDLRIQFRVTPYWKEMIKKASSKKGITMSAYILKLIKEDNSKS